MTTTIYLQRQPSTKWQIGIVMCSTVRALLAGPGSISWRLVVRMTCLMLLVQRDSGSNRRLVVR